MLPTLAKYQDTTEPLDILQKAVAPLNELTANATQNLAQWLTWRDIAGIWLAKATTPEAVPAAQIPQQIDSWTFEGCRGLTKITFPEQEHSTSACQQDDIAAAADTPTQSTKLSLFSTRPQRTTQNNLPTPQNPRGH